MNQEDISAREKLILATIACIEKEGIHSVTIRSIAKEAGVNSAAINYYFGTKDKLVEAALGRALDNAMANFEMLETGDPDRYQALREFFLHNFEGVVNYPEITKAKLYNPFIKNEYDPETRLWLNEFLEQLSKSIQLFLPGATGLELKITVMQIMAALIMPGIFPGLFADFMGVDLREPENRKAYIDFLLLKYLGPLKNE